MVRHTLKMVGTELYAAIFLTIWLFNVFHRNVNKTGIKPISAQCCTPYTNQPLICTTNQMADSYMKCKTGIKCVNCL